MTLTIKAKLRFAFLGMAGLFVAFGLLALNRMDVLNKKSTEIQDNWMPSIVVTTGISKRTGDYRMAEMSQVLTTDNAEMDRLEKDHERLVKEIADLRAKYEQLISSPEELAIYQQFSAKYEQYLETSKQSLVLSRKNENTQAAQQIKQSGSLFEGFRNDLSQLVKLSQDGGNQASQEGDKIFAESQKIIIGASVIMVILAIILMWLFERMVSRPLGQITGIIQQLATGDVSVSHGFQDRYDEIGQTAKAVGAIIQTLKSLTSDSLELINSAQAGVLSARAEVTRHPGEFGAIISGMNQLLEVLSKPLTEVAEVMQHLALGDLKGRMQGAYEGDLRALKANVNRSLDTLVNLLTELGEVTQRMAKGDLTLSVTGNYQGDFATLKTNTNKAIIQMNESLKVIVTNTENISVGVTETTKASSHVAEQSSQQMSAIEEMASAVTETSASIGQISENAKRGNDLAGSTAQLANVGRNQLSKLVEVIEQIATEYGRIEQITGKITRIADKTHLLSLNAGLEAVRAGEHGLGFGFVAQQIGKLAEEASIAARDIGNLITGSMQSVRLSVTGAQETRSAMEQIAKAAQDSGGAVQAISAALLQQSTAIEWISEKVHKVQSSGEANAAAAEEISQTMGQLTHTVQQTHTQVQRFTLA